jgi:vacuolar-type H+-ATPase subunit I/STV1
MRKKLILLVLLFFLLPEFTFALSFSSIFSNFKEGVFALKAEISETVKGTSSFFKDFFQWLGEKITKPFKKEKRAEEVKPEGQKEISIPKEVKEKISSLEEKIKELEARPPQIKEVEVERKVVVQPVKEVEKITEFIPSEELAKIKSQLSIFGETLRKIQPNPPYTTALTSPIYIQQGIQGGAGIFTSLAAESAAFRTL